MPLMILNLNSLVFFILIKLSEFVASGDGSGSKSTPSTNNNASNGNKFGAPSYLLLLVLLFGMKY